jgi:hypothetical protein
MNMNPIEERRVKFEPVLGLLSWSPHSAFGIEFGLLLGLRWLSCPFVDVTSIEALSVVEKAHFGGPFYPNKTPEGVVKVKM